MKLSYHEVSIQLDKLYFSSAPVEERALVIEAFLETAGWNWDKLLSHIIGEADLN